MLDVVLSTFVYQRLVPRNFLSQGIAEMISHSTKKNTRSAFTGRAQFVLLLLAGSLSACGGGGGGGGGSSSGPAVWSQQVYVKAADAGPNARFGTRVAIAGDTMVVGANDVNTAAGAAYVFVRSGTSWSQQAYLQAPNTEANDRFGVSVALSGDTIVVGAEAEDSSETTVTNGPTASADNSANGAGAAYVFVRSGTSWSHQAYLKAPNAEASDRFGLNVAISGDTIVVAATDEDSNETSITNGTTASADNSAGAAGAAYVFVRSGTSWSHQAYLKAANAEANDRFGFGVAISGDTIVVSTRDEDSNETSITNGPTASADNSASSAGAAYVFVRSGTSWSQQAYLKASNAEASDRFGNSVAISGDTIVVAAFNEKSAQTTITNGNTASADNAAFNAGAAYVFVRSGTSWSQQAYLKAPNGEANDALGMSVAISGNTIAVGAYLEDSNQTTITNGSSASSDNSASAAGATYVYVRSGTSWSHQAYLKAANAEADDNFGVSVAISGDTIVVGANNEDSNQTTITNGSSASADNSAADAGAVYVFKFGN